MEGVTDPRFREVVLVRHSAEVLGGAFTEFLRVTSLPVPPAIIRRHLGPRRFAMPVGLQLMGAEPGPVAETARRAVDAGAPVLDLNFGCPAKGALRGCAGSAVLDDPERLATLVRVCVDAVAGAVPVTAKIRAGIRDASTVEDLARAAEAGGAAMLTIHCRTREEGYQDAVDWTRIRRAVEAVKIPVCGNGGVTRHADLQRMRSETGCAFVMVGRAALADPWIFSGHRASREEAARFLLDYAAHLRGPRSGTVPASASRLKQLLSYWTAGDLVGDARKEWLREPDPATLIGRLEDVLR
jgi:tRNA-dihydrouridine synthase C